MTKVFMFADAAWQEISEDRIIEIKTEDKGEKALDKFTVLFDREILSGTYVPSYQNEIKIQEQGVDIFAGRIDQPRKEIPLYEVVAYSYGERLLDEYVNEIYEDKTIEEIVTAILVGTGLTLVITDPTGITIDKIVFKNKKKAEAIELLMNTIGYIFFTDVNKNAYMQPKGATPSGEALTVGNEVINQPFWEENPGNIYTTVIVEGDRQNFSNSESFMATASQTIFTLSYIPVGNINVTINGTRQEPQVDVSTSGDYTVVPENKQIILNTGATAGQTVVISYDYSVPIKITAEAEVFDEYGNKIEKETFIKNKSIQTFQEARNFAREFLRIYSKPTKSTELKIFGYNNNLRSGKTVVVNDPNESITGNYKIIETSWSYPENIMTIKIGTNDYLFFDWQKEVMQKIRELETESTNQDNIQIYQQFQAGVNVFLEPGLKVYEINLENSFIANHVTLGRARETDGTEVDCAVYPGASDRYGTWSGTKTGDSYYITGGHRLWCGNFNGTDNYVQTSESITGVTGLFIFLKDYANSRDVLSLATGIYISLDAPGNITTTGLTNVVKSEETLSNGWKKVYLKFDSITADLIKVGNVSTFYSGKIDEFMLFNSDLTTAEQSSITNNTFNEENTAYPKCELWWAFDNNLAGDRKTQTLVEEQ